MCYKLKLNELIIKFSKSSRDFKCNLKNIINLRIKTIKKRLTLILKSNKFLIKFEIWIKIEDIY